MVFRVLSDLNPFKHAFDCNLYLAILQTHPEVLPLLFSEPQTNLSSTSEAVEKNRSHVLIHWLLEPRESAVWFGTVDFLIQVRFAQTLADRSAFDYQVLLGRNLLSGIAVVDVTRKNSI